jgi:hypothetical protein
VKQGDRRRIDRPEIRCRTARRCMASEHCPVGDGAIPLWGRCRRSRSRSRSRGRSRGRCRLRGRGRCRFRSGSRTLSLRRYPTPLDHHLRLPALCIEPDDLAPEGRRREAGELAVRYSYGLYGPSWAILGYAQLLSLTTPAHRDALTPLKLRRARLRPPPGASARSSHRLECFGR